jgi:hypothetical protein
VAIGFVGATSTATNAASITVGTPAGATTDLLVLLVGFGAGSSGYPQTPSGWTYRGQFAAVHNNAGVSIFTRRRGALTGGVTIGTPLTQSLVAHVLAFSGAATDPPAIAFGGTPGLASASPTVSIAGSAGGLLVFLSTARSGPGSAPGMNPPNDTQYRSIATDGSGGAALQSISSTLDTPTAGTYAPAGGIVSPQGYPATGAVALAADIASGTLTVAVTAPVQFSGAAIATRTLTVAATAPVAFSAAGNGRLTVAATAAVAFSPAGGGRLTVAATAPVQFSGTGRGVGTLTVALHAAVDLITTYLADDVQTINPRNAPHLAVEVRADLADATFTLDDSELDGDDVLDWGPDEEGGWWPG